jgi:hypothetical protein
MPSARPIGNDPTLSVVATCVWAFQGRPVEHLRRELEVKAPRSEIAIAFPRIPPEAHGLSIRLYIRRCTVVVGLTSIGLANAALPLAKTRQPNAGDSCDASQP